MLNDKRFFHCKFCGHKLRFGASLCGSCYQPTQVTNRTAFWWAILAALVVLVLLAIATAL